MKLDFRAKLVLSLSIYLKWCIFLKALIQTSGDLRPKNSEKLEIK